ncbi:MAG: LysR substrate-binding domain-containing protein [Alphaproteobacteria bacterium]
MQISLDTDLLRSFVAIADTGSFTRAADDVGRTQSAVSMQVKRLEEALGRTLFLRSGRTVHLTSDGMALLGYARRILALQEEAVAQLVRPELSGHVRIGTPDDYINRFLPGILARFARDCPNVEVEVHCEPSQNLRCLLDDGRLDLALVSAGYQGPEDAEVWRDPLVWATSPLHLAHEQEPLPLALSHPACTFRHEAIRALEAAGRSHRVAFTSPSLAGQMAAVSAGLAVTLVCRSSIGPEMRVLGPADGFPEMPEMSVFLAVRRGPRTPLVQHVAEHIVASFRTEAKAG